LHREFDAAHPGAFTWDYVESGPERWQVRIGRVAPSKEASSAGSSLAGSQPALLPKLLCETKDLAEEFGSLSAGAVWKLAESDRQLDANLVHLQAGRRVEAHVEPALDVLLVVVSGAGVLGSGNGEELALSEGRVVWLPHGSRRSLNAGADGLLYLTVHRRRPGMSIRLIER
jgi:quercetin dioxygenase-like cupin family protein